MNAKVEITSFGVLVYRVRNRLLKVQWLLYVPQV